jgi:hypothetical protein
MIPKVAGKGRSFKGAGLYYLHDKERFLRDPIEAAEVEKAKAKAQAPASKLSGRLS